MQGLFFKLVRFMCNNGLIRLILFSSFFVAQTKLKKNEKCQNYLLCKLNVAC